MDATSQPKKRATKAQSAALPGVSQMIALALEMAEGNLRDLISIRCNDEHWDDADVDVDNVTELALAHIMRMKDEGLERSEEFEGQWFVVISAVNLAAKAFSRTDCRYARSLKQAVHVFSALAEAVEFSARSAQTVKAA